MKEIKNKDKHRLPIFVSEPLRRALEKEAIARRNEKGAGRASISCTVEQILDDHFFAKKKIA